MTTRLRGFPSGLSSEPESSILCSSMPCGSLNMLRYSPFATPSVKSRMGDKKVREQKYFKNQSSPVCASMITSTMVGAGIIANRKIPYFLYKVKCARGWIRPRLKLFRQKVLSGHRLPAPPVRGNGPAFESNAQGGPAPCSGAHEKTGLKASLLYRVRRVGFEPTKAKARRFTVSPR